MTFFVYKSLELYLLGSKKFQKGVLVMANTTEMVFIIDKSGSMSGLESDTIGGFNSNIDKQLETGENVLVTTVLFDTHLLLCMIESIFLT